MNKKEENKIENYEMPDESIDASEVGEIETSPLHPIAEAIDSHILRICDLRSRIIELMHHAAKSVIDEFEKWKKVLDENTNLLDDTDSPEQVIIIKNVLRADEKLEQIGHSEILNLLATGHFLTLFATFDAFTGDLLTAVYEKKPSLFSSLDRSMTISEMLTYGNVDDIKKIILESEIDTFRRKSYIEQFQTLENRFGLNLRKFKNWPTFVECGQRRNLFTHCDGKVSDQYIAICKEQGLPIPEDSIVGSKLELSPGYLLDSCTLMIEVILKLGQTIWRKLFPEELKEADKQLISIQYDFLSQSYWGSAIMAGDYGVCLPKHADTINNIIIKVNYIIALRKCEKVEKVKELLDSHDWSALCNDFRLAEKVLREDYNSSRELMEKIGKEGDFVDEHAYHVWPLFRDFRQTDQFMKGYKKVYGYDFATKLKKTAEESSTEAKAQITQKKEDIEKSTVNEGINCSPEKPQPDAAPDREKHCGPNK